LGRDADRWETTRDGDGYGLSREERQAMIEKLRMELGIVRPK
jgi:hypothetical protein